LIESSEFPLMAGKFGGAVGGVDRYQVKFAV
jgi:hypothetical protein